jgi:phosphoribosyl 1,2-cyclic phosphodiesterase
MEHVDWLDPDKLVINNSDRNKPFLDDIASGEFKNLRLLFVNDSLGTFMRYEINGDIRWYDVKIVDKRSDIYYLNISNISVFLSNLDLTKKLENLYKEFNREDILNKILK